MARLSSLARLRRGATARTALTVTAVALIGVPMVVDAVPARAATPTAAAATASTRAFGADDVRELTVAGQGGVPQEGVSAVVVNITATNTTAATHLVAWASGTAMPTTSNLNAAPGEDRANLAIVPVGVGGRIALANHTGRTDVVVDVVGWIPDDDRYVPITSRRVLDTRAGGGRVGPSASIDASLGIDVPAGSLVVVNLTGIGATAPTHVTMWPTGQAQPETSNLNLVTGAANANLAMVRPGVGGKVTVANHAGSTDLVVDVLGWFVPDSGVVPIGPTRLIDTRTGQGPLGAAGTLDVATGGFPGPGGTALVNLTGIQTASASFVTAWDAAATRPATSNLNLVAGQAVANVALVARSAGAIRLFNSAGHADLVVDALAWFPPDGPFNAITPARLMDTRNAAAGPAEVPPPPRVRRAITYSVATTGTFSSDPNEFAMLAAQTLHDQRGWSHAGLSFTQVASGGDFTLWLATADRVPVFGTPCTVNYSCRVGRNVIINETRWRTSSAAWLAVNGALRDYRHMVINHEVGHWLGRGHTTCPAAGAPAPVMQQQSKDLAGCTPNPWPLAGELAGIGAPA